MTSDPDMQPAQGAANQKVPTRLLAILALVPTVPMLLASVGALALFYIAPTRFGGLIARLPGESFIRAALFFAPATLFAVVVLAALYALERPVDAAAQPLMKQPSGERLRPMVGLAARWGLAPSAVALLGSVAVWGLSFAAPGRFGAFIEPLPGTRYLERLVDLAPLGFLLLFLALTILAVGKLPGESHAQRRSRLLRLGMALTLTFTVPALLGALLVLALSVADVALFTRVLERLPLETIVRVGLIFTPAVLFAVVFLALLVLRGDVLEPTPVRAKAGSAGQIAAGEKMREQIATWVLVSGLVLTSTVVLASLVVAVYLAVR
jgi:hypothetical protein